MAGESIEVQDVVDGDTDFEIAFSESCARAGDRGDDLRTRRQNGTVELFKVISGSEFVDGYDWCNRVRVDVGESVWVTEHRK